MTSQSEWVHDPSHGKTRAGSPRPPDSPDRPEPALDLDRAVEQIASIHEYMARGTLFRGYRAMPSFVVGLGGLTAAFVQSAYFPPATPFIFVVFWCAIACAGLSVGGGALAIQYLREDPAGRARVREVSWQFLPCVFAGLLLTLGVATVPGGPLSYLPGTWALLFGVGAFSIRPYLPPAFGWVALYHFLCGTLLLALADTPASLSPWGMGLTFGLGQILSAAVLYTVLERKRSEP